MSVHPTAAGTLNIGTRNMSFRQGAGRKREAGRETAGWKTSHGQVKVICKSSQGQMLWLFVFEGKISFFSKEHGENCLSKTPKSI